MAKCTKSRRNTFYILLDRFTKPENQERRNRMCLEKCDKKFPPLYILYIPSFRLLSGSKQFFVKNFICIDLEIIKKPCQIIHQK